MKEKSQAAAEGAEGATRLARCRVGRGFASAAAAAKAAGIPEATYRRYEDDMSRIPAASLAKICAALDVSADELLGLPTARRSDIEELCAALPADDRQIVVGVARALAERERARAEHRRAAGASPRLEAMARYYERRLYDAIAERAPEEIDLLVAGAPEERAAQFEDYVLAELAAAHDRRVAGSKAAEEAREKLGEGASEEDVMEEARDLYWAAKGQAVREEARQVALAWRDIHSDEMLASPGPAAEPPAPQTGPRHEYAVIKVE